MLFSRFKNFDSTLFVLMVLLIIIGLSVQYSLSLSQVNFKSSNFVKQSIFAVFGLVLFFVIASLDFRFIKAINLVFYILVVLLLLGVLIFGQVSHGVKGWFNLGFFNFQPIELAKLAALLALAQFWGFSRQPIRILHIIVSFIIILPLLFLIMRQPDFGSAMMIVILWFGLLLMMDRNKKHILGLLLIIILIGALGWSFFLKDYQQDRILTYLNPQSDQAGRGYQITQSTIAVGSGQIFGRGFGLGTQSQLRFLPASETDFIFAALTEEFGLMGTILLLGFYIALISRLVKIAKSAYDNFSQIFVLGAVIYFFSQAIINIGMNVGLFPIVGIPLPFISYGGSSLLVSMLILAIIESILLYQPFTHTPEQK
ncbi:MAG: rod shape-determining protein RodA [Patescibacteria group bacterium]|nr:rod shape-determining protein RodA [Patescibacteria group bacterium]MDD5164216.1 rod shape-determining protein RodA [Patescibacteria group bacterium]MDD5534634.1 rod shape-determining protein RodA [Patescibacteria group bacterium]